MRIDNSGSGEGSENKQFWQGWVVRIENSGMVGGGVRKDNSGRDGGGEDRQFWQW